MINPYSGEHVIGFFTVFFGRFWGFLTGKISYNSLVTDEVQIIVLSCVAASGALVGVFLVLRRMTLLANALSHTILLGIVSTYLLMRLFSQSIDPSQPLSISVLLIAAFSTGIVTTFLTEFLSKVIKLQEDASIGLVFSILFAMGIVMVSLFSRNAHVGTELVMGNADALQKGDIRDIFSILVTNILLFCLFFHGYKVTTFDPQLARALGFSPLFFNYLLMIQTSATAVGGFRAVGVLMILAFFVMPPLTARLLTDSLSVLIWLSMAIGVGSSIIGVALSRHFFTYYGVGLSTAGIVVTLMGASYILTALLTRISFKSSRALQSNHIR